MRLRNNLSILLILVALLTSTLGVSTARAAQSPENPVVYGLLFYSPTCAHCHQVINEVLPSLFAQYQDQLYIIGVNVATEEGAALYSATIEHYQLPQEQLLVPALLIDDKLLVGGTEIPEQLPGIIEEGLASGGIYWPDFPLLLEMLEAQGVPESPQGEPELPAENEETVMERFARDLTGNIFSLIVLSGMVVSVFMIGIRFLGNQSSKPKPWADWIIPALLVIGLIVASYLSYVELTQTDAVCGPVGDCHTVHQSPYARLFGILSIGTFGVIGYTLIAIAWAVERFGPQSLKAYANVGMWLLAIFGTAFSIYLTFLEPFVIGATCMWCLLSAIIMTVLLWATTPAAFSVLKKN